MGAFGPGDTEKNLQPAVDGETFEIEEMYLVCKAGKEKSTAFE